VGEEVDLRNLERRVQLVEDLHTLPLYGGGRGQEGGRGRMHGVVGGKVLEREGGKGGGREEGWEGERERGKESGIRGE